MHRNIWIAGAVSAVVTFGGSWSVADIRDDVGWTALNAQLGGAMPTGSGVTISQVEALDGGHYSPAPFAGKTITDESGFATGTSNHAQIVGGRAYGTSGIAPGVTQIDAYSVDGQAGNESATGWFYTKGLNYGTANFPVVEQQDVQIHAWVGDAGNAAVNLQLLTRHDYQIRRDNFVAVVGVNNEGFGAYQALLASGMNNISVGTTNGGGVARPSGAVRPLIVAPDNATSYATGTVAGAAAMLIQAAGGPTTNAGRSETIKAVLLAGATKSEFPGWARTSTRPLDSEYGAGEVNVQNSYNIIAAGEKEASNSQTVASRGFDYGTVQNGTAKRYFFDIAAGQTASSLSVALTWHVNAAPNTTFSFNDLDLRLFQATTPTSFTLLPSALQESIAAGGGTFTSYEADIWNVEHLWLQNLAAGRYAIEVVNDTTSGNWDYSLAWNAQLVPEPTSLATLALVGAGLLRRSRRRIAG